ncbi:MAG TPA: amino acid permease [Sandaracinaceae bacterium LLY-WYZ-13_1]|nr:amino acid permease [Sandaracinaceae bacterium LLY-WYZ-13_1]
MSDPRAEAATPDGADRHMGLRTATFLVVASMIGTGVFTTSGLLLEDLRSAPAVLLAWAVGGLLALTGALSYAELVAAMPSNGGEYHLLGAVFHPALGFASGVVSFVVGFSAPIAASALAFGSYAHGIWSALPATPTAVALVVGMCAIHGFRVRTGDRVQDALTAFKVLLVLGFIGAGAAFLVPERLVAAEQPLFDATVSPSFAVALIYVSFSFSGWNAATYVAGEVKHPARTLPMALAIGTALVTALYLGINLVFLGGAPADALAGEVEVGHVAAVHLFGRPAGTILGAIIALGLVSTVGALVVTGTRVLEAMGRDHGPLALLARRAVGGGPFVAVGLQGIVALAMVLSATFDALLAYIGFTLSVFAALTVLGVLVMRWRAPDLERPYRTWGYPVTPLLFVGLMVWMIARSVAEEPVVAAAGAATIGLALGFWVVVRRAASE